MNKAYDSEIRLHAKETAKNLGISDITHEGIYACLGGPSYETIAELKMLKMNGVDAVGKNITFKLSVVKVVLLSLPIF